MQDHSPSVLLRKINTTDNLSDTNLWVFQFDPIGKTSSVFTKDEKGNCVTLRVFNDDSEDHFVEPYVKDAFTQLEKVINHLKARISDDYCDIID